MIDVCNVDVSFGDVEVLSSIDVGAETGALVGLVGPNGSGKTTLLRTISGAVVPDGGRVLIDGNNIHELSSKAASQRVAVVPQDTSISFSFDVRRIVEMGRTARRGRFERTTRMDHEVVDRAMERTLTERFADRSIDAISGGERQRVLIARAIAQETPALLLDEPTASLDVNHQIGTLELVRSLVDEGTAAIAAIHDLDLAARYCDTLVLLSEGKVVASGSPEEVLTEATVSSAFDVRSVVGTDPITGTASVRALPDREEPRGIRVHVVGSGTLASETLSRLDAAGFDLSFGPVVTGDRACESARSLGVDLVTTTPLSPPTDAELTAAIERAETADVTVFAGIDAETAELVGAPILDAARRAIAADPAMDASLYGSDVQRCTVDAVVAAVVDVLETAPSASSGDRADSVNSDESDGGDSNEPAGEDSDELDGVDSGERGAELPDESGRQRSPPE